MVFWASDSDFGSVIVECGSVSGVWLVPKCVAAVIEWVLAAAGRAGDSGSCPRIDRWEKMANMSTVVLAVSYHL